MAVSSFQSKTGRRLYVLDTDPRSKALAATGGDLNPTNLRNAHRLAAMQDWSMTLDIGANYGEMVCSFALPVNTRVWAFDPAPKIAACLRRLPKLD